MAEEFNPIEEGRRIARTYLSQRGWAGEWRRTLNREIYPAASREELEAKERQCDQLEEEAEADLSREYEKWRKDDSSEAKAVLLTLYEMLGRRSDLGFFAKRIIDHLKRNFPPA